MDNPQDAAAHKIAGEAHIARSEYQQAAECFQNAVALVPADAEGWSRLGWINSQLGDYQKALKASKTAVELDPENAVWSAHLGGLYGNMEEYGEAVRALQTAVELDPNLSLAWNNLGVAYGFLGSHRDAVEALLKASELEPGNAEAWENLGVSYGRLGNERQAVAAYERAVELDPENGRLWGVLGSSIGLAGEDRQRAIAAHQKRADLEPTNPEPWGMLGMNFLVVGKYKDAVAASLRAVELDDGYAMAWGILGESYRLLSEHEPAIEALQKAAVLDPDKASWHSLGSSHLALHRYKDAVAAFEKALEQDPDDAGSLGDLGLSYLRLFDHEQAVSTLQRAVKLNPEGAMVWGNLGAAYAFLRDHQRSAKAFHSAVTLNPTDYKLWEMLGMQYSQLGERDLAYEAYQKALRLTDDPEEIKELVRGIKLLELDSARYSNDPPHPPLAKNHEDVKLGPAEVMVKIAAGESLSGIDLGGIILSGADMTGADMIQVLLAGADLSKTALNGALLSGAVLSGANLYRADLVGANLMSCVLTDANLSEANLSEANLIGADLHGANLDKARYDLRTKWPAGFSAAEKNMVETAPRLIDGRKRDPLIEDYLKRHPQEKDSSQSETQRILKTTFGHDEFREYQEEIIQHVCDGNDVLAVLATGYGKSICYQIPALALEGTAIVISPLISLMKDQVDALLQQGIRAAFINSTQNFHEQEEVKKSMAAGGTEILYLAPERIVTDDMAGFLSKQAVSLIAIDEAHCVSRWGPSFREDYLALDVLADLFPGVPRIALTATADAQTRSDVVEKLRLNDAQVFVGGFDRPNLRYEVAIKQAERQQLMDFLSAAAGNTPGIVYCRTRARTEKVAAWMTEWGYQALVYHAGLSSYERSSAQRAFLTGENVVIVATIAFGMGIDKPDVSFVVHMDLPKTIESYHQETGRAGRDGAPADLLMLYGDSDAAAISRFIFEAESPEEFKAVEFAKLQALLGYCETIGCRREALLRYFGEDYSGPCGNCDNCEEPPGAIDGTALATRALECVAETGQRFGTNYLVDVLLGSRNERVLANGHDRADIYGAGHETGRKEWRSVYRQLIAQGCIELVYDRFPVLRLNARSKRIVQGEEAVRLRKDRTGISSKYGEATESRQVPKRPTDYVESEVDSAAGAPDDHTLFAELKQLRRRLALEQDVPPYMIFHDSTLHEMVASRPATRDAFRKLKGVGDVKLRRYSGIFLDCISGKYTEASAGSELPPAGLSAADRIAGRAGGSGMSDWHLVTALRQLRAHLADSQGVPEYVIFPNYTLDEMVEKRPASPEEFLDLKGVGEVKLGKYGPAFLRVINAE